MFVDVHNNLRKKCMSNMKRRYTAAAAMMMVMGLCASASAAFDENLNSYTLDSMIVEADAVKNKFGDTITEQSYYRTGGDVKVITREEIEKRHYTDVSEAIKRIPGVVFRNPGYRGGEYGFTSYNNTVSINGDDRVIILVDGRRVDNAASTRLGSSGATGNKSTGVNLDQVTNMENVDKIEVIKGPGASVYGADATGGVINIITRKGGQTNKGSIDLATGSWDKHKYAISYSGSAGSDNSFHYFVSANRDMSGDTKFKDGDTGKTGTLYGGRYKEDGVNVRIDKDFNDKQNLKIWYNYKDGKDGYPICTPRLRYFNAKDWADTAFKLTTGILDENNKIVGDPLWWNGNKLPGYINMFQVDGAFGSYNSFKNNDLDIQYTFNKENGMDSFFRVYNQTHTYTGRDVYKWAKDSQGNFYSNTSMVLRDEYNKLYPNGATAEQLQQFIKDHIVPFPGDEDAMKEWVKENGGVGEPNRWSIEKNRGAQLQYAKTIGQNDIIASVTYDKSKLYSKSIRNGVTNVSHTDRTTITGYIQDKIHASDKWDITPALRYSHYKSFNTSTGGNKIDGKGASNEFTPTLNTEYMFDDTSSMYFGWTKIMRPIKQGDYTNTNTYQSVPLDDEKGNVFTLGVKKDITDKTTVAVHYDWTKMSNSIARLPVVHEGSLVYSPVNAKEDKKSINLTLDHQFDEHFTLSASYSHMKDKWMAKDGWSLDPSWGYKNPQDVNTAINSLRPANQYALNLSYENGKLYTGLLTNWYTGCSRTAFTDKQFLVLDWNVNYEFTKDLAAYLLVNNLTNEAYQTAYSTTYGGASMPGRCIMVGMKYTF